MSTQQVKAKKYSEQAMVLTQREAQCINLVIQRKTTAQIAEILEIGQKTVYFYLTGAGKKLSNLAKEMIKQDTE